MVLPEDSNNVLCDLLDRIAESMEKNTTLLNRIADHYDSVVPVMLTAVMSLLYCPVQNPPFPPSRVGSYVRYLQFGTEVEIVDANVLAIGSTL